MKSADLFIKLLRVVVKEKNQYLFYQKHEKEWLAGQWEVPTFILETNDDSLKQYPRLKTKKSFFDLPSFKTGITKYTIENFVLEIDAVEFKKLTKTIACDYKFKTISEKLNLSTTSIKVMKKNREKG